MHQDWKIPIDEVVDETIDHLVGATHQLEGVPGARGGPPHRLRKGDREVVALHLRAVLHGLADPAHLVADPLGQLGIATAAAVAETCLSEQEPADDPDHERQETQHEYPGQRVSVMPGTTLDDAEDEKPTEPQIQAEQERGPPGSEGFEQLSCRRHGPIVVRVPAPGQARRPKARTRGAERG